MIITDEGTKMKNLKNKKEAQLLKIRVEKMRKAAEILLLRASELDRLLSNEIT
jgi:hypothetical protein